MFQLALDATLVSVALGATYGRGSWAASRGAQLAQHDQRGEVKRMAITLEATTSPSIEYEAPVERPRSLAAVPLFAATLFVGSFLMFLAEPMVAKMILPILGGAPMVWNTCVLFFQITLFGGYACAHGTISWLGTRRSTVLYLALLVVPFAVLPVTIRASQVPPSDGSPIGWLLLLLVSSIGLPFLALATSSSLLQKWFSLTDHPAAADPYFLYGASNLGSLLALLSYPAIVEPTFRLGDQSRWWAIGYVFFVALALLCMAVVWNFSRSNQDDRSTQDRPVAADSNSGISLSWRRRLRWVALSFIPSSLMLAVTNYLSTDIAAVPLMWTVPLSLYLLTFVAAFSSRGGSLRAIADRRMPVLIVALAVIMIVHASEPVWLVIPLHLLAFAISAFLCHSALASDRPSPFSLTQFYAWIAFGGMLGGLFNALVAPVIFKGIVEYPLVLVLACLFRTGARSELESTPRLATDLLVSIALGALTAGLIVSLRGLALGPRFALHVPALLCFSQAKRPRRFALSVGALLLTGSLIPNANADGQVLHAERTFFGVYRINLDPSGRYHSLIHGTTLHGMQALDKARQNEPLTYYHRTGPFGQAFVRLPQVSGAREIAVVGLGIGTLASYASSGQRWTFYELDPAVERLARSGEYFTFLRDCGDRCRVVLGDARLSVAQARPNAYGLIVLDAFSSDAIPMHLMTTEAVSLYLTRLAPGGVLAFHISNRHLELGPVLARLALAHRLTVVDQAEGATQAAIADGKSPSEWMMMARDRQDLGPLIGDPRWVTPSLSPSTPLWSDDFSNILSVLSLRLR